ncbi:hypothetical protein UPYG_G00350390 [Umbra pygmaea]|uniref:Nucleoside-diphosphate kinase n=1 Tax=Umbra pygmaea TaxID=75934 RepID=A0ABD0VZW4_UMBPY
MADEKTHIRTKRVFVNDIDTYSSKYIAQFLSTCVVGDLKLEASAGVYEDGLNADSKLKLQDATFQIVGTISNSVCGSPSFALECYSSQNRDQLLPRLLECDVVVYNISENATAELIDQAMWAISALHSKIESFTSQKMFILISSVMTWAMSKPPDPNDPEIPLTEDDIRRKKPHAKFQEHAKAEKMVLKLGKTKNTKWSSYIVTAGIQYGMGENLFHYFFKVSWLGELARVPVFGPGTNVIPTIHVRDLASVVLTVIVQKPKAKCFIAVDESKNTLEDIVQIISFALSHGKIQNVPKEEAYLSNAFTNVEVEYLNVDLHLESGLLKDFKLAWASEDGIVGNIDQVVMEYKQLRQLQPIKICLLGPPAVGKSTVAEKLSKHYKLHHIKLKNIIDEKKASLEEAVKRGEDGAELDESVRNAQDELKAMKDSMLQNKGRLGNELLYHIICERLYSKPCQNQGFVLDGFPKSYNQAKDIFYDKDYLDEDMDLPKSRCPSYNKNIIPEFIFSLEASDNFLKERVQNLPQSVADKMGYTQEEYLSRLNRYRKANLEDETVLNYFDELEIQPDVIDVNDAGDIENSAVLETIIKVVGLHRNYGPTIAEREEMKKKTVEEKAQRLALERAERERREAETIAKMNAQLEEWRRHVTEVKRQECELLEARSTPLRNYLMKYIIPTLSEALVECCRITPDDPVDFLAEYLLRNNSQD